MSKKKNLNRTVVKQQRGVTIHESFIGPLPSPSHLEKYEQILPGAADRIISMAEKQSSHRQDLEKQVIKSDIRNSLLGLIFGFIIGLGGVSCGFYLIYIGKIIEGGLFSGATIVALVSAFIYGSTQRRKERASKN